MDNSKNGGRKDKIWREEKEQFSLKVPLYNPKKNNHKPKK